MCVYIHRYHTFFFLVFISLAARGLSSACGKFDLHFGLQDLLAPHAALNSQRAESSSLTKD